MREGRAEQERRLLAVGGKSAEAEALRPVRKAPPRVDARCVTLTSPDSYESGQYMRLRLLLEQLRVDRGGLVVGLSSPAAGDGKSLTAINLAGALAGNSKSRVLLMDVDLRRKSESLHRYLSLPAPQGGGLTELLLRPWLRLEGAVHGVARQNLSLLLTGSGSVAPYEALASERFGELVGQARAAYDFVILDGPPAVPVPDCRVLSSRVDGFLMVIAAGVTPRAMLAEALRAFDPEKLLGLVLNRCDQLPPRYYRYYGNYGYANRARQEAPRQLAPVSGISRDEGNEAAGEGQSGRFGA